MVQNQYTPTVISTNTTKVIQTGGNITIHSISSPIAMTGTAAFKDTASSPITYFTLPIASIGSLILDASFPNGLQVVTSASDTLIITTQTP